MTSLPNHTPSARAQEIEDEEIRRESGWWRQVRFMTIALGMALLCFTSWTILAPLSGAVVAPAEVKVEHQRKTLQHQEGGIVRGIFVRNGQRVVAGQPLLLVGDARAESTVRLLREQWRAAQLRAARAQAEVALLPTFTAPKDVEGDEAATILLRREQILFHARQRSLDEHLTTLRRQQQEARAQSRALLKQVEATEQSARLANDELDIHERLAREGFIHRTKLMELQRLAHDYAARVGEHQGDLAAVAQRLGELEERMNEARNRYRETAAQELKDATASMNELEERLQPSLDQLARQVVRAPVDGEVMELGVSAVGQVLGPRQALLVVVPSQEKLVVEARIAPQDIAQVRRGAEVHVRLSGVETRSQDLLPGKVLEVSADRHADAEGKATWFTATVEMNVRQLAQPQRAAWRPGTPAEVFITTADRTLLDYLLHPLFLFNQRALREA